ncbi:vegetative cell wall protein gp1-like [Mustela erminea]|uniref:vegetative cell wall protein gp1-like n=1 Tax=Mustela erminea TaxID=36723 RepID=UPI00138744BA|nr:vegetative cell wall protein gp1-like [Mustela erminea]
MYWPQGAHGKGKSSSSGALFDPFVTNSRQTCQELNSSTLARKTAKNAALSTRSFPGPGPTLASRGSFPPPERDAPSEGPGCRPTAPTGGPGVHSPIQSAAWKAEGSPWTTTSMPRSTVRSISPARPTPAPAIAFYAPLSPARASPSRLPPTVPACPAPANESKASDSPPPR